MEQVQREGESGGIWLPQGGLGAASPADVKGKSNVAELTREDSSHGICDLRKREGVE